MKKMIALFCVCVIAGCAGTNKEKEKKLTILDSEPENCLFLYKINTMAAVYDVNDAIEVMEDQILAQDIVGDSYLIISKETQQNDWVPFGPEHKYIMTAKVYDCLKK